MKTPEPRLLLQSEWGRLFIRWVLARRPFWGRAGYEISTPEFVAYAKLFAERWRAKLKWKGVGEISSKQLIDTCLRNGYIEPSAGNTLVIRKDLII